MGDVSGAQGTGIGLSRRELMVRAGIGAGGILLSGAAAEPVWARARSAAADEITIGFVSPRTGAAAGFGEPDPLRDRACEEGLRQGPRDRRQDVLGQDRRQGQPVEPGTRGPGGERPAPQLERRPHARDIDAGDGEPGLGRIRGCRDAVHLDRGAVGGLVLRPWREARQALAVQVHVPLLLRRRAVRRGLHAPLAAGAHEQEGRRDVAERLGRQRHPRCARAAAQEGRLHDRRPRRLHGRDERLLVADLEVQVGELRDLQHVPDPARLRDVLASGRPAGLQAQDRRRSRRRACSRRRSRRSARSASTSRAPPTGRPPTPTPPRSRRSARRRSPRATRRPAESSGTSRPARASRSSTSRPPCSGRAATRRTRKPSRTR